MAKSSSRELLITLGAETTSFTKQIKRANDLTKELDSNFKLMSSSNKNYEDTLKGVGDKQDYLTERIEIFNKKSDAYVNKIKEQQQMLNNATKDQTLYTRQQDAMNRALEKLKGTDAYEVLAKQLEIVEQKLEKANKEVNSHTDSILSMSKHYNDTQREIQVMTNELAQLDNKMENLKSNDTFKKISDDIKESQRQFNNIKSSTENFGSTMKDLVTIQTHYESQLEKNNNLLNEYSKEIDKSTSKIDKMENYVDELTKELTEYQNTLNGMKSTDEGFQRITTKVENLRVELTGANSILNSHKDRLEEVTQKYKSTENEIASLSGKAIKAGQDIEKMSDSVSLEKLQKEIKYVNDVSLENLSKKLVNLKTDFENTSTTTDKYSGSMEGLGNKVKTLEEMLSVCKKSTKLYTEQLDALGQESKEITTEINKVEKSLDYYKKKLDSLENSNPKWDETNNKIKELNETHKELVAQLTNVEKKTVKSQQGFKAISQETVKLTSSINKTKEEMKSLDESLTFNKPKEEVKEFTNVVLENLNEELNQTKQQFDKVSNGAISLDSSMEGLGTKVQFYKTMMEQTTKVIQAYEEETQDIINKNEELTKELNKVQKSIEKIENTRSQNLGTKEWDKQVKKLEKQNQLFEELTAEIEKNSNKISENESKVKSLSSEYEKLEVNVEKTNLKMSSMTDSVKIESVQKEVSYFNDYTIKKLSDSLDVAKQDFKELSSGIINMEEDMEGLSVKVGLLEDMIEKTNSTMNAYKQQINALVYDQKKIKSEIESTEKTLNEYQKELSSLEGTEQWDIQKTKIEELNSKHKELVSELKFVENKLKSSEQSYSNLNSELSSLSVNVENTKEKMQQMKDAIDFKPIEKEVKSLSEQAVERLKDNITELNERFSIFEKQTSESSDSVHTLTAKSNLLNQVLSKNIELEKEFANDLSNTNFEIKRLTSESGRLEQKLIKQEQLLKSNTLSGETWKKQKEEFDKLSLQYDEVNKDLEKLVSKQKQLQTEHKQTSTTIKDLNIQIDNLGDNIEKVGKKDEFEKLNTSISDVAHKTELLSSKLELVKSSYKNFETSIKGARKETELLKEKNEELNKQYELQQQALTKYDEKLKSLKSQKEKLKTTIEETKNSLKSMNDEFEKVDTLKDLGNAEKQLQELENEIKDVTDAYREMQLESMATKTEMNNNVADMGRSWELLGTKIQNVGGMLQGISSAFVPLTGAVTALGAGIVTTGTNFEESMSKVKALSGATEEQFKQLEQTARDLGKSTVFSATDASEGLQYLALAGYSVQDSMDALPIILDSAVAGAMELSTASDLATDVLSSLGENSEFTGDKIKDLDELMNQVAKTSTKSNTSMEQLLEAYIKVGGQVENMNIPLSTANTMLGILADKGIKAEEAGNSLNSILINLTQTTGQSADAMEELGVSAFDAEGNIRPIEETLGELKNKLSALSEEKQIQLINMIGGKTQAKTLQKLLQGIDADTQTFTQHYSELRDEIEKSVDTSSLEKLRETMEDNLSTDWKELTSALEESFLKVFEDLQPQLREIVQSLTETINTLSENDAIVNAFKSVLDVVQDLINKFNDLSPEMQENVIEFVIWSGILAPIIGILGNITSGVGKLIEGFGKLPDNVKDSVDIFKKLKDNGITLTAFFKDFKGTISKLATLLGGSFATTLGSIASWLLPLLATALVVVSQKLGDNREKLMDLQDNWGGFGEFIALTLEGVNGLIDLFFGKIKILCDYMPRVIESLKPGGETPAEVWDEMFSEMELSTKRAMSNMNGEMTKATENIRTMTQKEFTQMSNTFSTVWTEWENITTDGGARLSERLATQVQNMDTKMIETLRGTSDTMALLFADITEHMNVEQATNTFKSNIKSMVESGQIDITTLQKDFEQATEFMYSNFEGSSDGIQKSAEEMFDAINDSENINEMARNITDVLEGLNETTVNEFKNMGDAWKQIFLGINMDSVANVEDLREQISGRISALATENPKFIEQMQTEMQTYFSGIVTDATISGEQLAEVMEENGYESIEEFKTALEEGKISSEEVIKQLGLDLGTSATEGFTGGLQDLPQGLLDQLNQAGVIIDENGVVIREDMSKQAIDAVNAFVESMNSELPQLDGVTQDIQDRLNGIDSVRLGNVTKQLSEVNRWLGVVQQQAVVTYGSMSLLTSLKWGNTTNGLSEVNNWLMRTTNRSNDTRSAMIQLTNLPFGNTTKGLSEVNNWLMRTTNRSKDSQKALKSITEVTFGATTKGLSEINKWLTTVKTNASGVKTALNNIKNVTFGSVTKGLSEVNRWLNTIASSSRSASVAISNVKSGRAIIEPPEMQEQQIEYNLMPKSTLDMSRFKTSGGWYSPISIVSANAKQESMKNSEIELMKSTLSVVLQQNQLLINALTQSRDIVTYVNVDGRQVAKASAKYMESEINLINSRKNRLGGK